MNDDVCALAFVRVGAGRQLLAHRGVLSGLVRHSTAATTNQTRHPLPVSLMLSKHMSCHTYTTTTTTTPYQSIHQLGGWVMRP